ncbi:SSI family serine proteinase inhibitor [Streptomyces sp. NPDC127049]|uniref:SSI family serine proteinase inhibitor n=1 Tax=Streptomyces sp. NPDC127049 TaxID=3347118 RepID=UPI00364A98E9
MKKITTALATFALAALTLTGTATAAPAPGTTEDAHIWLTVTRTAADRVTTTGNIWLDCPGQEGVGHPHRESACIDVDAANGDFDQLPGTQSAFCSNETVAVTATAHGTAEGRPFHWERTYESDCHLTLATGHVFDF